MMRKRSPSSLICEFYVQAVAEHVSCPGSEITSDDVILCSGCSCSLDLCISAIANPGQNILVPRPGFPIYTTLANGLGIDTKGYNLIADQDWDVDLGHLESLIDENTAAIMVNNPSNPCGSVFSKEHLMEILEVAERNRVPIIADEIYDHFAFPGRKYYSMASLTNTVPVLSCGGLTKRFLVPGWRLGWITIHDKTGVLSSVRLGLQKLSQRIIGANTIVQGALPAILKDTPASFFESTLDFIRSNAELAYKMLSTVPGLKPVMPSGAMYMMIGIDRRRFPDFFSDLEIVETLVKEQSVFALPGKCFDIDDYVRIVLTVPREMMIEACDRIRAFCARHYHSDHIHAPAIAADKAAKYVKQDSFSSVEEMSSSSTDSSVSNSSDEDDGTTLTANNNKKAENYSGFVRRESTPTRLA